MLIVQKKEKKIALKDYVDRVVKGAEKLANGEETNLSIGFSDDDKKNIEAVVNYIENELSGTYPNIKFLVYLILVYHLVYR